MTGCECPYDDHTCGEERADIAKKYTEMHVWSLDIKTNQTHKILGTRWGTDKDAEEVGTL